MGRCFLRLVTAGGLAAGAVFLPAAEPAKVPAEALKDFSAWKKSGDYTTGIRLREVLKKKGPEGEALAAHILESVRTEKFRPDAIRLLSARAFTINQKDRSVLPHLDGPYLKTLARMSVPDDPGHRHFRDYHAAIAYLKLHPEDHEIYWRLRLAATRDAKVEGLPEWKLREEDEQKLIRPPAPTRDYGLNDAWEILMQLDVLKAGVRVEDAIKILGKPDARSEKSIRWYYNTPRHVNPLLFGDVKEGRIVHFRNSKG